jgi:Sec-independent protein translocase protein TatA
MPSLPQVLIVVAIVFVLFGGGIFKRFGRDIGYSIKGLKDVKKEVNAALEDEDVKEALNTAKELKQEVTNAKRT